MLTAAAVSLLIGALLSRGKVLILIPPFLVTMLIAMGLAQSGGTLLSARAMIIIIIGLQIGYLLGAALHHQAGVPASTDA